LRERRAWLQASGLIGDDGHEEMLVIRGSMPSSSG
jgi:hypothetical protein